MLGIAGWAGAQSPPPGYRQFTADDGLPSSEVYEVIQDRQGFLWFSTDNGVSRFNGYGFENFGALQGLADPVVFYLQEDTQGRTWMKGMSGRLYYFEKDSIHAFAGNGALDSLNERSMSGFNCNFYVDSTGQIFNSIFPVGLMRFSPGGNLAFLIKNDISNAVFLTENQSINVFCGGPSQTPQERAMEDSLNQIGQWSFGIQIGQRRFNYILPIASGGSYPDSWLFDKKTLVISGYGYLFGFEEGRLVWQVPFQEKIIAWHQDSRGGVYLGLGDREGARRYRSVADLPLGRYETLLKGYSVAHLLEDREGGFWFATTEAGVFYLPNPSVEIFDHSSGLPVNYITSIALKNEEEAFIGLEGGGILSLDARLKSESPVPSVGEKVADLAFDTQNNRLWGAAKDYTLQYFSNGKWHEMINAVATKEQKRRTNFAARHFHFSHDKRTIWATSHAGFFRINLSNATVDYLQNNLKQPQRYNTRTLDAYTASSGRTWVANIYGLFELKNDQLLPPNAQHPAFSNRIEAIEELLDGTLVLGSKGYGLVFWKGGQLATLTEADGLTANMIENLHVDGGGTLWAGTLNGLNKIKWRWEGEVFVEKITTAHGLPSNEITDVTTWDETIWVGTTKGLARFSAQAPNPVSNKPMLKSILTNRRPLDLSAPARLSFLENNLTINYFTINYKMNGRIPYRYRLNDDNWKQTFSTTLHFAALPPGDVVFEVQSQNEDGVWSESSAYGFTIRPPWYQTWWFATALAALLGLGIWGIIRYRTAQVRKEEKLKTAFYKELSEKEMTALRSQMNPHFIFNCLNSINNLIVRNSGEMAASYVTKFSRLMRLVLDNSRQQRVPLEKELEALRLYMDMEALRFDGKFRYEVWVDDAVDEQYTQIPPLLIQPYVENAIWHGLMHKPEGGSVVVDVRQPTDDLLLIEITDDGVGRERAAELESKTALTHKPQGSLITAERLKMLNLGNNQEGKVTFHDLVAADGQPIGTRVVLEIPV